MIENKLVRDLRNELLACQSRREMLRSRLDDAVRALENIARPEFSGDAKQIAVATLSRMGLP